MCLMALNGLSSAKNGSFVNHAVLCLAHQATGQTSTILKRAHRISTPWGWVYTPAKSPIGDAAPFGNRLRQ